MKKNYRNTILLLLLALGLTATAAHGAAPATAQGFITGRSFNNLTGTAITALTNSSKFPSSPDALFFFPYFEWNATGDIFTAPGNFSDNYGGQIVGYFYPPATGDYSFLLSADDNAILYLSPSSDPADKRLIAQETVYSNAREYDISGGNSDLPSKDSSQFPGTQWPVKDDAAGGAKITLQAGQPYYIEALFKEGTGGDFLSVAVRDPNFTIDSTLPIPGEYLSSDRTVGPASIVTQPASQTIDERGNVTFQVVSDGTPPYTYQWRKNGADIPDATNLTYTVTRVTMADQGARYSVVVTGANGSATSQDAVLTVTPDTIQPRVISAKGTPNHTEVVITFSEPVDQTTAGAVANYSITATNGPLNITGATLSPAGTQVVLTTAEQTLGRKYTVLVSGVKDTAATPNTIVPSSKAVFFPAGKVVESNGFIVFEAENYDRNLDGIWVRDTTRGTPSGGASVVAPNGAGGSETATKLEYDLDFQQAATYVVWIRASGDNGNDDSVWIHIDGDGDGFTERPAERVDGNQASLTGFQPQADFVWRNDSQDGPDPFTIDIPSPGPRVFALARREDGSFVDKVILTTDTAFTPSGAGPAETREGAPGLPVVSLTSPSTNATFAAGANVNLTVDAAGQSGLDIARVEYTANGTRIGESTTSPFSFTWTNVTEGIYAIRASAFDEVGQGTASESVVVNVTAAGPQTGARIAWVSFHPADATPSTAAATAGFTNASDVAYTKLLRDNGHDVTRVITSGNPNATLLNAFDLVIVSRAVPSGDYQDPPETLAWNSIKSPMIILGGYAIRASRLGLATGDNIPDTAGPIKLKVNDKTHPVFEGISLDANDAMSNTYADRVTFNGTLQRGISVVLDPPSDGGTVLATVDTAEDPAAGGPIITEWKTGATTANARADVLGGNRMVFLTGSRENDGLTSEGAGIFDLSADGAKMFLNAVNYMAGVTNAPAAPTVSVTRGATGLSITYTGTLQSADNASGPYTDVANASSPHAVTTDGRMKFFRSITR